MNQGLLAPNNPKEDGLHTKNPSRFAKGFFVFRRFQGQMCIRDRCEPRLREQCFGKYEGTPRNGGEFRVSKTHFADRYDGGESMMQLAQRIYNLLDELKADTGKTYLLVAHNGIARVVQSYFYDMTNEEYAAAGIRNCELVEYHFE